MKSVEKKFVFFLKNDDDFWPARIFLFQNEWFLGRFWP
jgi:hypothetical protein